MNKKKLNKYLNLAKEAQHEFYSFFQYEKNYREKFATTTKIDSGEIVKIIMFDNKKAQANYIEKINSTPEILEKASKIQNLIQKIVTFEYILGADPEDSPLNKTLYFGRTDDDENQILAYLKRMEIVLNGELERDNHKSFNLSKETKRTFLIIAIIIVATICIIAIYKLTFIEKIKLKIKDVIEIETTTNSKD